MRPPMCCTHLSLPLALWPALQRDLEEPASPVHSFRKLVQAPVDSGATVAEWPDVVNSTN